MTSDSTHAVALSQLLHDKAKHSAGVLWLAVDAANDNAPPLPEALEAALGGSQARAIGLTHPNLDPVWRPRWLRLDTGASSGSLLLQDSIAHALQELEPERLRLGQGRRISGWLQLPDADVFAATTHFASEMIRRRPAGTRQLVRLHDPAVLWALWPLLAPGQRRQLLGPVTSWALLDPVDSLCELRGDGSDAGAAWSPTLWQDVDDITALNAALRSAHESSEERALPKIERQRAIAMEALRRARALGFSHARDLSAFATHAIAIHPAFDRHPLIRRALKEREADDHYLALVDSLSSQDWLEIGRSSNIA